MRISFFLFLTIYSCSGSSEISSEKLKPYFDLVGLIDSQILLMDSIHPEIQKKAFINGEEETNRLKPDSSQWANELNIFKNADINKSVLFGQYNIKDLPSEPTSNLKIRIYEAKNPREVNVNYLKIYFLNEIQNVRKIEASVSEINPLFKGNLKLQLNLTEDGYRNLRLKSYLIEGEQKMLLMDTVNYKIEVEVF